MSALLDELLAGYVRSAEMRLSAATHAKAANPAKNEAACGLATDSPVCEGLRISANGAAGAADSQEFAAVRKPHNGPQSQQPCGFSQKSQDSQGVAGTSTISAAPGAWTDDDVGRFQDRRARLMRWGWSEQQAEALAERLVRRDHEPDDRRLCLECRHYRPGQCGNHQRAALTVADVGRDFATMIQRCSGFEPQQSYSPKGQP